MKKGRRKGGGKNKKRRAINVKSSGGSNNNSRPRLRFRVGDGVECCLEEGWISGTVIRLRCETDIPGAVAVAPYQVLLENGNCVFAPFDEDRSIRLSDNPRMKIQIPKENVPLRFDVGDRVEFMTNGVYLPGTIVKLWPESDFWEKGGTVPYEVRLDNGIHIFSICDADLHIKLSDIPPVPVENFMKGDRVEIKEDGRWRQCTVTQSNLDWVERADCAPFFVRLDDGEHKFFYGTNIRACDNDPLIPISEALEKLGLSDNDSLFETPPPMPDCPICFLPLPIEDSEYKHQACCGATLCHGCIQARIKADGVEKTCPFCRAPEFRSDKETVRLIRERVKLNDAENIYILGCYYHFGSMGLPQDLKKGHELFVRAADLGSPRACTNAGIGFDLGKAVEKDEAKGIFYLEKGAKLGQVKARHALGDLVAEKGEWNLALRHLKISASAGYQPSLDNLKNCYRQGMLSKEELADCLRAQQETLSEAWSEDRAMAKAVTRQSMKIQSS